MSAGAWIAAFAGDGTVPHLVIELHSIRGGLLF